MSPRGRTTIAALILCLILPTALADEIAQLKPVGTTTIQFKNRVIKLEKTTTVALKPGDQVCVQQGKLEVLRGPNKTKQVLATGQCLQVTGRSDAASVATFVQALVNNPRTADTQNAQSRGDDVLTGPAIHLPNDYALETVLLPISGRPNPKTLKLFDAAGKVIFTATRDEDSAVFELPTAKLRVARKLEVMNAQSQVLYAGAVYQVSFSSAPKNNQEAALRLLATGQVEYAPIAYSYLVKLGDVEGAKTLEEQIRLSFTGG